MELTDEYKAWAKSPSGIDLRNYLQENYERKVDEAVDSSDLQTKALLLQEAQAYKTIKAYIDRNVS